MKNYLGMETLAKLNLKICKELESQLGNAPLEVPTVVYGVARGGIVPALFISHHFDIPLKIIHLSSYEGEKSCKIKVESPLPCISDLTGVENVIIADDIVDSGKTMKYVLDHFNFIKEFNDVHFNIITCTTIKSDNCKIPIDHYGDTNDSSWIVFPYEKGGIA
jgi:hypoxanthine phosphoribosyltransferase